MGNGNGNGNGRAFGIVPRINDVPIVGQPFTLKNWFMTLLLTCNCSPLKEPLLVVGAVGAMSPPCPHCGRQLVLSGLKADPAGQLQISIGMTAARGEADASKEGEPHV